MSAVGLSLAGFAMREIQIGKYSREKIETRQFALASAKIALARLQELAGTDSVSTSANPNPKNPFPHVAWNIKNPPTYFPEKISQDTPVPLCSDNGKNNPEDRAKFHNKIQNGEPLSADWEYVGDNFRFAYLIIDKSQKFPLIPPQQKIKNAREIIREEKQEKNQLLNFNYIENQNENSSKKHSDKLQLAQYDTGFLFSESAFKKICRKSASLHTFGVLADWKRNRLKKDLSDETRPDEYFPQEILQTNALPDFPYGGLPVSQAISGETGKLGIINNIVPVPVDLKLHIGFINARTDGQHRVRFHVTAKLWNPNAFPILAHADGQLGLIDFKTLPTFFIRNLDTNGKFSVNLSDFPTGRFGLVRQTPSDKTLNAYCKIFDTTDQGFGENPEFKTAGLHAGSIYTARFPEPRGQPAGLSRITGGPSWKFQKNTNPEKPPAKAVDGRWFHDLHRINIFSMPSMFPGEIVLRHYNGPFQQSTHPENYSKPIVRLTNIRFPYVDFTITGKEYNRAKAGDYNIGQANLVYQIRLKHENESTIKTLLEHCELRSGLFDFSDPVVADAFEISVHTGKSAQEPTEDKDDKSYFFDRFINEHRTEEINPAFSVIQIYDLPNRKHASAGTLRFLQTKNLPPLSIGKFSEKTKKKQVNQILDRYFFSLEKRNENSNTSENPLFVHKDLTLSLKPLEKDPEKAFAEQCMIRGPFNINSTNPKAWEAVLSNVFDDWEQYSGRHSRRIMPWDQKNPPKNLKNVFFTRPFSAQFFPPDGKVRALTDTELELAPLRSREQFLLGQGFRSIKPEAITALAEFLSKSIAQRIGEREPFLSVSDFADSGLIERGIAHAGINTIGGKRIPAWFPNFIRQEHLFETLALRASPRGDSFSILVRAEKINPLTRRTEAGTNLEMRVQRIPELFDPNQSAAINFEDCNRKNKRFGRRFKIVSIKFL